MGRSILTDPDRVASAAIFGTKIHPVSIRELSRKTGICHGTLANYRKSPGKMTLARFGGIAKAMKLTDEEIVRIVRSYRG